MTKGADWVGMGIAVGLTGLTKQAIHNGITKGNRAGQKILAEKDKHGNWLIWVPSLEEYYGRSLKTLDDGGQNNADRSRHEAELLRKEIEGKDRQIHFLERAISDLEGQRDKWQEAASKAQTIALTFKPIATDNKGENKRGRGLGGADIALMLLMIAGIVALFFYVK